MLDGRALIDVHLHPARLPGLKLPWDVWLQDFGTEGPQLQAGFVTWSSVTTAAFAAAGAVRQGGMDGHRDGPGAGR